MGSARDFATPEILGILEEHLALPLAPAGGHPVAPWLSCALQPQTIVSSIAPSVVRGAAAAGPAPAPRLG